jgi:DNA-binding MarR family transcriptional regulator
MCRVRHRSLPRSRPAALIQNPPRSARYHCPLPCHVIYITTLNYMAPLTMSTPDQFNLALREWLHVFMTRSTHDLVRFLKEADLTMGQYSVLMRLSHDGQCGVTDVGGHLGITNAAASQLVDKLVQQSLVERSEHPTDRRIRQLSLTANGRDLVQRSMEARIGWTNALFDALPTEQRAAVIQGLRDLAAAAQSLEQPAPRGFARPAAGS